MNSKSNLNELIYFTKVVRHTTRLENCLLIWQTSWSAFRAGSRD